MNTWIRRSLQVGLLSAGFVIAAGGAAHAADLVSVGNQGTGNGNQVYAPIQLPVNICGNAISAAGNAIAGCEGGASANIGGDDSDHGSWDKGKGKPGKHTTSGGGSTAGGTTLTSVGNQGTLNGNQVYAPVQAPINICGNAIAATGNAQASCRGGASANQGGNGSINAVSAGNQGTMNGNQIIAPVQAPINICGLAVSGAGNAQASCEGGSEANIGRNNLRARSTKSWSDSGTTLTSIGNQGTGNGTQVFAPVQAPVNTCGTATSVGGNAIAGCKGGAKAVIKRGEVHRKSASLTSIGNQGTANGTQVYAPVQAPVNECGNATTAGGNAIAGCRGGSAALLRGSNGGAKLTSVGNQGTGNGTQVYAPVQTAVETSGNATSATGNAIAASRGGALVSA